MSTLSRREEDTLFKATKANALRECDELVKGMLQVNLFIPQRHAPSVAFADCAAGRTVSVAWTCREKFRGVQDCVYQLWVLYSICML
jgi:COX assembly protein 1